MARIILAVVVATASVKAGLASECTGHYGSRTCEHTLYFNDCKNTIKVRWEPLKFPGTVEFKQKRRTWCSVEWNAEESVKESKFPAKRCDKIIRLLTRALRGFPEVKWQDSSCTHFSTKEGVLYSSWRWEESTARQTPAGAPSIKRPPGYQDPEPEAVALDGARECRLHGVRSRRVLRCPVLSQSVQSWLRSFAAEVGMAIEIRNALK